MPYDPVCTYIRSLIPLYAGGKCTQAESMILQEHCGKCPACREKLLSARKAVRRPHEGSGPAGGKGKKRKAERAREVLFLSPFADFECGPGDRLIIEESYFRDGIVYGRGTYIWADGSRYEGDFVNGKRSGKGVFTWPGGDRYEGDFADGRMTGKGKKILKNGECLEGIFEDGRLVRTREEIRRENYRTGANLFREALEQLGGEPKSWKKGERL